MRTLLSLVLLCLGAVALPAENPGTSCEGCPDKARPFLESFAGAVERRDREAILALLETEHRKAYEPGRRRQFIDELFLGVDENGVWTPVTLEQIEAFDWVRAMDRGFGWELHSRIRLLDGRTISNEFLFLVRQDDGWAILGPAG
jgi:hypothetical protein